MAPTFRLNLLMLLIGGSLANTTSAARKDREPRSKPYYRQIEPDLHLGFRKGKTGGRWCARYYNGGGAYTIETFAKAIDSDAKAIKGLDLDTIDKRTALDFWQAQKAAKRIYAARQVEALQGSSGPITVRQVVDEYIDWPRRTAAPGRCSRA